MELRVIFSHVSAGSATVTPEQLRRGEERQPPCKCRAGRSAGPGLVLSARAAGSNSLLYLQSLYLTKKAIYAGASIRNLWLHLS